MAKKTSNNKSTKNTTSKRNKSARKKIGIAFIAVLSIGITVLLSVGATLAFFAGSTTANNALYMGGPVYLEMTGRNNDFLAGNGNLDISAFAGRTTGTAGSISNTILLPGPFISKASLQFRHIVIAPFVSLPVSIIYDTVWNVVYFFQYFSKQIITTSKLVVCSAPIRVNTC